MFYKILWQLTLHPGSWFRLTGTEQWCQSRMVTSLQMWRSRWHQGGEQIIFLSAWELSDAPGRTVLNAKNCLELKIFSNWKQTFENHFGIWVFLCFCQKINKKKNQGRKSYVRNVYVSKYTCQLAWAWAVFEPCLQPLSIFLKTDVELHVRPGDRELQCLPAPANRFGVPLLLLTGQLLSHLVHYAFLSVCTGDTHL